MRMSVRVVGLVVAAAVIFVSVLFFTTSVARAGSKDATAQGNTVAKGAATNPSLVIQRIRVSVTGLVPYTIHAITLDQGRCGGPVLWSVQSVLSDRNGSVNRTYTLPQNLLLPKIALWVNVHQKNTNNGVTVICRSANITTTIIAPPTPTPTPEVSLPDTGVSPQKSGDSYNNYAYPLKH